jgi:thiamine-monophosphate kinase
MGSGEFERIRLLERTFAVDPALANALGVEQGIGDDAAVFGVSGLRQVWTIDEQVEGVHYRREWLSWGDVGFRAFMAAASDLAAMGALPRGALVALGLPDSFGDDELEALALGVAEASRGLGAPIVGGNMTRAPCVTMTTTLLGQGRAPVLRSGARPGERLYLAGKLGLARCGLRALETGAASDPRLAGAVAAFRRPVALVSQGRALEGRASAAIDVSDGLVADLGHMAEASGVGLVIEQGPLAGTLTDLMLPASTLGLDGVTTALYGGEDYALVATSSSPLDGFVCIGRALEGRGVWLDDGAGLRELAQRGFDHFAHKEAKRHDAKS